MWISCCSGYVPLTGFGQGACWATVISGLDLLRALSGGCGHELSPRELLVETHHCAAQNNRVYKGERGRVPERQSQTFLT